MNVIIIKGLKIDAAVGVTAAERDNPQRLEVDAVITPLQTFAAVADEIGRTVDYQAAAQRIAQLARARPRCLIETLASELAEMLVSEFHAGRAGCTLNHISHELVCEFGERLHPARHQRAGGAAADQQRGNANDSDRHEQRGIGDRNLVPADVAERGELRNLKLMNWIGHCRSLSVWLPP